MQKLITIAAVAVLAQARHYSDEQRSYISTNAALASMRNEEIRSRYGMKTHLRSAHHFLQQEE